MGTSPRLPVVLWATWNGLVSAALGSSAVAVAGIGGHDDWSCPDAKDCESCYNYSSLCHWCGVSGCHARGDVVHGCLNGVECWSCSDMKECTTCYNSSSWCHWCGSTGCKAQGNVVGGCVVGTSCQAPASHPCLDKTTCGSCYKELACHWCPDSLSCHPWGSAYGCAVGASCYSRESCVRKEPEWLGFAAAKQSYWFIFGLLELWSICACACCLATCYHSRVSIRKERARDAARLLQNSAEDDIQMVGAASGGADEADSDTLGEPPLRCGMGLWRCYWRFLQRCIWHGYYPSCACWLVFLIAGTTMGALLVFFSPHAPLTTICYDGVDWSGIVKNINVGYGSAYYVDYEILLSLYNPNRVDLNVTALTGIVHFPADKHNQREVGTVTLGDFFAKAGSITDSVGMLSFSMDRWNALDMGGAYESGDLKIAIDLSLGFEVRAHKVPLSWSSSMQMDRMIVNVNDPTDYTYCRCKGKDSTSMSLNSTARLLQRPGLGFQKR